jgi:hypothetical protein
MTDITSKEDEQGRALAKESGRKEGVDEERLREKRNKDPRKWIMPVIWLIVLACIITVAAFLTLSVSVTNVSAGTSLPFTTSYGVTFPEGQTITIGNSHMSVLSYENELISDIDGDRQKLVNGEDRVITERRAVITTFGIITLMDTHFQINLKYKGNRDNRAYFDMSVHTSQQMPDMLLKQLLPPEIDARPL